MKHRHFDFIGDIHGHHAKLVALLARLGYRARGQGFRHPEGRQVVFLGDYIDRGPQVREVLHTVRAMVEAGDALALMGNHEYNAICYHTPDGRGDWLRPRRLDRDSGLRVSLAQFHGMEKEWDGWLQWMRGLPLFLDLGDVRAVHACWDARHMRDLVGASLLEDDFLHACAKRGTRLCRAVDHWLKGPEMQMPEGCFLNDREGYLLDAVRVRWWDIPETARVGDIAMPEPYEGVGDANPQHLRELPNYGVDEPPVFFGHYWLAPERPKEPLRHNLACLDFSAAGKGPLVAYRWDGETVLSAAKFVGAGAAFA